ncbi:hypothetical protein [Vallitalea sp.]|jgi:hypothetical protein|uniref:hypothetical protein n=1 Tax=Vallitalea sp. TaxID=1882829 RepID=UPI0025FFCA7B|nr:hypothetical protein [Vallitalea sp.]MCT4688952.1 hypothetical protein [Vallitalea sp.]
MKKLFNIFMVLLLVMLPVSSVHGASSITKSSVVEPLAKSSPIYIVGPYDENSDIGYVKHNDENGDYYTRVRETKLVKGPSDDDPVVDYKRFGTIYRTDNFSGTLNETVSLSHSVSISASNTISASVSLGINSKSFSSNVSISHSQSIAKAVGNTVTKSYSKGFNYGFPIANAPANCTKAERGVGFQFQIYRSIIDVKKLVNVDKYIDIVRVRHVNECSICNGSSGQPIPGHIHDGFVGNVYTLADGTEEQIDEYFLDFMIKTGIINLETNQFKKTVKEWKKEVVVGEVKLPVNVMITTYFDKDGNIIDEDGNIINY